MAEVDFDRLASAYRFRPASPASLERAARAGSRLASGTRILDVGGGPANHALVWAEQGHRPVVLDPSTAMAATAQTHGIQTVVGYSQAIPFRPRTFDLVWFHLSVHYGDWQLALDEAQRVVAEAGRVEVWTLGEEHHRQSILAQWFPSIAEIDSRRFPDPNEVVAYLARRMPIVAVSQPHEVVVRPVGAWLQAVEAGFVSTLHLLSDEERATGVDALRTAYPDPTERVSYELHFTRITGDRRTSTPAEDLLEH